MTPVSSGALWQVAAGWWLPRPLRQSESPATQESIVRGVFDGDSRRDKLTRRWHGYPTRSLRRGEPLNGLDQASSRFLRSFAAGVALQPGIGTGYRVRTMHEPILVCTVGKPQHKPFPSTFDGIAREHSRKPDEFYDLVLSHTPQAIGRADLFSRQTRPGFEGWGNEHGKFDESPTLVSAD
jgi:hypothetical protein